MEMAIDDAGLYLRTISDGVRESRWEINYAAQYEVDKGEELNLSKLHFRSSHRRLSMHLWA
jgi:hypothetical protein